MADHVEIHGVRLHLSSADPSRGEWIGQGEVLRQLLACDGPYLLDVVCPYQEHVLPMIPSGHTVRDIITE